MFKILSIAVLAISLITASYAAEQLSPEEHAALLRHYDKNGDGEFSEREKAKALRRADKGKDGVLDDKDIRRLQHLGRKLLVKEWFTALDAEMIRRANGPKDKLEVMISKSVKRGNLHYAFVYIRWGDLSRQVGIDRTLYKNWDGGIAVAGAAAQMVDGIKFDDFKGRTPKVGRGADKITEESRQQVSWESGVVGGVDGLVVRLVSGTPEFNGMIHAGKFKIPFTISGLKAGSTLPDGTTIQ